MALLDDSVTVVLLASAAFFVALAFGLLLRYRQVSQRISASSDLGRDLWNALEQRMRKQDERILDVMGRLEVLQSRVMAAAVAQALPPALAPLPPLTPPPVPAEDRPRNITEVSRVVQQSESQRVSQESHPSQESLVPAAPQAQTGGPPEEVALDETQLTAIRLLADGSKNTRQLTDVLQKSREHTARIMKGLFELGLVNRNDSTKPFVYQLTDEGRRALSSVS